MLSATLHEWKRKIEQLQQRWRGARQENERLRKENEVLRRREKQWESEREQWERERKRLERERERLRGEIDNLKRQLEEAQRANKRQAAPFSRRTRKEHPKTPGRKPGAAYGRRYCKLPPKQVDEIVPVPLPRRCSCRGAWSSIGPSRNISRKSCARPSGDASISTSAIVRSATNECKGAIRDRPLTL